MNITDDIIQAIAVETECSEHDVRHIYPLIRKQVLLEAAGVCKNIIADTYWSNGASQCFHALNDMAQEALLKAEQMAGE